VPTLWYVIDILVESPPEMVVAGRDVQLEKAIEFLMDKIGRKSDRDYETPVDKR
jgi:hypothetical protein